LILILLLLLNKDRCVAGIHHIHYFLCIGIEVAIGFSKKYRYR